MLNAHSLNQSRRSSFFGRVLGHSVLALTFAFTVLLGATNDAHAYDYFCEARVAWYYIGASGEVNVKLDSIRGSTEDDVNYVASTAVIYPRLCDLDSTWNGITPLTCAGILSTVTAAKLSGQRIRVKYNGLASTTSTCKDIPNYSAAPAPTYVKLYQ